MYCYKWSRLAVGELSIEITTSKIFVRYVFIVLFVQVTITPLYECAISKSTNESIDVYLISVAWSHIYN